MYTQNTKELVFTQEEKELFERWFRESGIVPTKIVVALGGTEHWYYKNDTFVVTDCSIPDFKDKESRFLELWSTTYNTMDDACIFVLGSDDSLEYVTKDCDALKVVPIFERGIWSCNG